MGWPLLIALALGLAMAALWVHRRRSEIVRTASVLDAVSSAKQKGTHDARLRHPQIDLTRCIGCGACIEACPEDEVLGLAHGQAAVVHGARCVGHGECAKVCPTGAIALTFGDLRQRTDIPALSAEFEVPAVRGLFLAGEVTGYALIATAIAHGTAIAHTVAKRRGKGASSAELLDLLIVGAGPAGIACALASKQLDLHTRIVDQEQLGGTVAKYPRRKLVMTQPVSLPLVGKLTRTSYAKEELLELWQRIVREQDLPLRTGEKFLGLERSSDGVLTVTTSGGTHRARAVCLAIGTRGSPNKLGVPGEELPKVAYGLIDANSYQDSDVLVVGGGDSAIEAALALAEQGTNRVTLSYRKSAFSRLKAKNEARLGEAVATRRLTVLLSTEVGAIHEEHVELVTTGANGAQQRRRIANDQVFACTGGVSPVPLLTQLGVSFDHSTNTASAEPAERGSGLLVALASALALVVLAIAWLALHAGYYGLEVGQRADHRDHAWLRPGAGVGLLLGVAAAAMILVNLSYLARRTWFGRRVPFTVRTWLTCHIATGILALLFALVHAGLVLRDSNGGHAGLALAALVATGALGRYFYAFVPRAANGRELELDEVRTELSRLSGDFDRDGRGFGARVRTEVEELVRHARFRGGFVSRVVELLRQRGSLQRSLRHLRATGLAEGVPAAEVHAMLELARRAQRLALGAAQHESVRGLLAGWRWFHRWFAVALLVVVGLHVWFACRFASVQWPGHRPSTFEAEAPR